MATAWLDAGVSLVVVTDGGNAVSAWTRSGHQARLQPPPCAVVDTVGAGDSFQAALLTCLAESGDPKDALAGLDTTRLEQLLGTAIKASAITCSRRGADLPRRSEVFGL
jgi:fructokinase